MLCFHSAIVYYKWISVQPADITDYLTWLCAQGMQAYCIRYPDFRRSIAISMKDITIRRPGIEERESIHTFFEEMLVDTFEKNNVSDMKELLQEEILDKKRYIAQDFETEGEERFFLLAEHKGEIIGSIEYGPSNDLLNSCTGGEFKDMLEIGTVFVRPDWQKRGISVLLMYSLFEELKEKRVEEVCFDSGYKIAQGIWCKRFGSPAYYLENYWGEGFHHMVWRVKVKEALVRFAPKAVEP